MQLYSYFRSSAAWRVRIALAYKGLRAELHPVHLLREGGEQYAPAYRMLNPLGVVPTLIEDSRVFTQSLAILEYLEDRYPEPALLPRDPVERAWVRALALTIACDIHPLNNLRVLRYLEMTLGVGSAEREAWYRHWVTQGLKALEIETARPGWRGPFALDSAPTFADVCLIPQLYNARRFGVDLQSFPTLVAIEQACLALPAFAATAPEHQPDAPREPTP
ncbi:MAG: maleylacetoacetate isomerase [Gammaproteobacteria bacterium]